MKESYFENRGIAYRTNGFDAGRPTLVFIHGLSGSSSAWLPYEELFGAAYNLLTFDLRGHGLSAKPTRYEDYDLAESAEDLFELLKHLGVGTFTLISHSFGTLVALEFLLAHPENVARTVFLSPAAGLRRTGLFSLTKAATVALAAAFRLFPFHPVIRGRVDYAPFKHTGDWNLRRIGHDLRITTLRVYLYCLAHAYSKGYDRLWGGVAMATLIVHGEEDSIIPVENARRLAEEIPGSELVILAHANHVIVLNNVPEVTEQLRAFAPA